MMGMTMNHHDNEPSRWSDDGEWENITKDEGHDDGDACEQDDDCAC